MADESNTGAESVEAEARTMGWAPKDKWRGPEAQWVDAETFVENGRKVLPILRQQNQQLHQELNTLRAKDAQRDSELRAVTTSLKAIEENQARDIADRAESVREELVSEIAQAGKDDDFDRVAKLTGQLSKLDGATAVAAEKAKEKKEEVVENRSEAAPHPAFTAWMTDNPWFGVDKKRSAIANSVAQIVKVENPELSGAEFFTAVDKALARQEGRQPQQRQESKVAGGGSGAGGGGDGGSGGSDYSSLPADAKQACDAQAKLFVGPGKRFKTRGEWQARYAEIYSTTENQNGRR